MGNKIITEKDFWMCSTGAVPAQLQGTRKSNKKQTGEVYITVADTATSSWIDFGCTKHMLFAALLAAVVAVVVVALIVGTGGIAAIGLVGMMAIGAGAGIVGGVIAAVDGALKCGQKNATQRTWDASKTNLIFTGTPAITGDRSMTCAIGGTVTFAPEIKSWSQAIGLAGLNYLTKFAECGLAGAAVGGGGYMLSGLATGSLALAMPTAGSIVTNLATSFTGVWGGTRILFGADHLANEAAYGNIGGAGDALSSFAGGAVPEVGMAQRIATGQAQPADYLIFLYLLNLKKGSTPKVEEPASSGNKEGNASPESEPTNSPEDTQPASREETKPVSEPKAEGTATERSPNSKKGEAFEDSPTPTPAPEWKGPTDYSSIDISRFKIEAGHDFTPAQKEAIYQKNMEHNEGLLRSDLDGTILERPQKSQSGVTPSPNEAQVDHINPKSKGGTNNPNDNAQVLSRRQNRGKSNN